MQKTISLPVLLLSVGGFLLLSAPSVKLIYSSELVNLMAFGLLALGGALSSKALKTMPRKTFVIAWGVFSILLWIFLFRTAPDLSWFDIFKYGYLIASVLILALFSGRAVLKLVTRFLLIWACVLAVWQLAIGIPTSGELGQHYLTVGLPLAVGLAIALVSGIFDQNGLGGKFLYFVSAVLLITAIATFESRSALLYPLIIFVLTSVLFVFLDRTRGVLVRARFLVSVLASLVGLLVLIGYAGVTQLSRIERLLFDLSEEPRMSVYYAALERIIESPLIGYGGNAPRIIFDHYPHNLFLDVLLQGGILLFFPFMVIVILYGAAYWECVRSQSTESGMFGFASATGVFFLQWNTSFDLTTAYIPIGAMAIFVVSVKHNAPVALQDRRRKWRGLHELQERRESESPRAR